MKEAKSGTGVLASRFLFRCRAARSWNDFTPSFCLFPSSRLKLLLQEEQSLRCLHGNEDGDSWQSWSEADFSHW